MSRAQSVVIALLLIVAAGCGNTDKQSAEHRPPAVAPQTEVAPPPEQAPAGAESTPQVPVPQTGASASRAREVSQAPKTASRGKASPSAVPAEPAKQDQRAPAASPAAVETPAVQKAPEPKYVTLAAGTSVPVRLQEPLDSGVNKSGDTFRAIVDKDLLVGGNVAVPRGSLVEGELTQVEQSGRVSGRAAMSLKLVKLHVADHSYAVSTETLSFEAESTKGKDATKVGLGAGIGAAIGAIAGGGKGAAIGAAVGAGAGGATVLATRGKQIKFESEHPLSFTLSKDVSIKLR